MSQRGSLVGHNFEPDPNIRVDLEVFPNKLSTYKSVLGAIFWRLDKVYLVLSLVVVVKAGVKVKSENSDICW